MAVELSLEGLGNYRQDVETALAELDEQRVVERIWQHDHTLWKPDPKEIANRLGWLEIADEMQARLGELQAFADEVREAGYSNVLLLGMGGSSLAPEVFRKVFGVRPGYLDLAVLDSTDPGAVKGWTDRLDPKRTLFLVSTKSGTTVETLSFFKFFYTWTVQALGRQAAGEHFVAITDPGSPLVATAEKHGFRRIFLNNPNIGGRYSALSYFGLVPAALVGVDLEALLERARQAMTDCGPSVPAPQNPAAQLGVVLGQLALRGRDKLTFVAPPEIAPFGDWLEQLVAESTGKEGKGILPVVGEPPGEPGVYGDDRVFAVASLPRQTEVAASVDSLQRAGHPFVHLTLTDEFDLGYQMFLWELATAIAGQRLGINPFDQPNVEAAKALARKILAERGRAKPLSAAEFPEPDGAQLREFLSAARKGAYVAVQAYVKPSQQTDAALQALRVGIRDRTRTACTVGYGPRYLHSTGQLHKGDAGKGLFVQFISQPDQDVVIPDEPGSPDGSLTFGELKIAQAIGDRQALLDNGRKVLTFRVPAEPAEQIERLADSLRE